MTELLPCPLCGSTKIDSGICYLEDKSKSEPAVRYVDCGCRATLAAWHSRTSAQSAVKPLPWEEINRDRGDGGQDLAGWEADSGFGPFYEIEVGHSSFDVSYDCQKLGDFDDPDQAKKCAQDHFETRIRAALSEGMRVPDGYALVPIKPTEVMIEAGCDNNPTEWNEGTPHDFAADVANDVYVSMVSAAPSPLPSTQSSRQEG